MGYFDGGFDGEVNPWLRGGSWVPQQTGDRGVATASYNQVVNAANAWKERAEQLEKAFNQVVMNRDEAVIQRNAWKRVLRRVMDAGWATVSKDHLRQWIIEEKIKIYNEEDNVRAQKGLPPVERLIPKPEEVVLP